MSWSKPHGENLLHYIETHKLYPIGVIPELSQKEIDILVQNDIITCVDLKNNPTILDKIGIRSSKKNIILNTLKEICNH